MEGMREQVKAKAIELGFDLAGVCDSAPPEGLEFTRRWIEKGYAGDMEFMRRSLPLRADLNSVLPGVQSVIACGLNYYVVDEAPLEARVAKYARGRDYHKVLKGKLRALGRWLDVAVPGHAHRPCVDSAPVFEREYAQRAGLGWFGKNTCLINTQKGSWFLIGVLLTTATIEPDKPAVGGCGTCRACIDACPTGAIVFEGERWQVNSPRCISYLTIEHRGPIPPEFHAQLDQWLFGCDICQAVCPFNVTRPNAPERGQVTKEPDFLAQRTLPRSEDIVNLTETEWDVLTQGSALRRTGFAGLRRNAEIVLRNRRNRLS
jgi:epoxyqueuosine reductase